MSVMSVDFTFFISFNITDWGRIQYIAHYANEKPEVKILLLIITEGK